MKIKYLLFGLLGLTACTSDLEEQQVTSELESITMNAKDFEYENDKQGRTSFEISNSGAGFTWAANDVVGICPSEGAQLAFPMAEGAGTKTASFTGGGWALMPSAKYMAYYPVQNDMFLDKTNIQVSYENQTQTGVSSTAHLGQCDFMAAAGNTPNSGNVFFNFEHLGSLVEMTITLPRATTYTGVTLTCEEAPIFTTKGKIDLTAAQPAIATVTPSNTISISLNDFTTTQDYQAVKVYFMAAPVNLNGKKVFVDVTSQDNYVYGGSFTSTKDWLAGKAYRCAATTEFLGREGLPYYIGHDLSRVLDLDDPNPVANNPEYLNKQILTYTDYGKSKADIYNNPKFNQHGDVLEISVKDATPATPPYFTTPQNMPTIIYPTAWGKLGVFGDVACNWPMAMDEHETNIMLYVNGKPVNYTVAYVASPGRKYYINIK